MTGTGFSGGFTQSGMAMPSPDMPGSTMRGGPQTDGPGAFGSTAHTLGGTMGSTMGGSATMDYGVPMQTLPHRSRHVRSVLSGTGASMATPGGGTIPVALCNRPLPGGRGRCLFPGFCEHIAYEVIGPRPRTELAESLAICTHTSDYGRGRGN